MRDRTTEGLRPDSQALRLHSAGYRGVFDGQLADEPSMLDFVRTADALMEAGQVLKRDGTSFVSRVLWNAQDIVVKRYNHQGLWHSLRHTIKRSRASRNWQNAHRLAHLRIATPAPLAYVEQYRGPLLWQSYFIARFVPGPHVREILQDETVAEAEKRRIHERVLELLRLMAEHGVSHGDMKHTNILYDGTDVVLTDLDAMRIGGLNRLWPRRCRQDADRYLRELRT